MQGQIQRQGQQLTRPGESTAPQTGIQHPLVRRVLVEQQQCAGCVPQHQIGQRHLPEVGKLPNAQGLTFLRGWENGFTVLARRIRSLIRDSIRSLVRIDRGRFRKA